MDAGSVSPDMRTRLNLLTVIILSVYVDGLSLILRLSRPSPSLAQNAGRVERVSVKNAGLEPLSLSLSLSMTTLTPPPPSSSARKALHRSRALLHGGCRKGRDGNPPPWYARNTSYRKGLTSVSEYASGTSETPMPTRSRFPFPCYPPSRCCCRQRQRPCPTPVEALY